MRLFWGGIFWMSMCALREFACQMKLIRIHIYNNIHKSRLLITIQFQEYYCLFCPFFLTHKNCKIVISFRQLIHFIFYFAYVDISICAFVASVSVLILFCFLIHTYSPSYSTFNDRLFFSFCIFQEWKPYCVQR